MNNASGKYSHSDDEIISLHIRLMYFSIFFLQLLYPQERPAFLLDFSVNQDMYFFFLVTFILKIKLIYFIII
jgi:hypothetical protein